MEPKEYGFDHEFINDFGTELMTGEREWDGPKKEEEDDTDYYSGDED